MEAERREAKFQATPQTPHTHSSVTGHLEDSRKEDANGGEDQDSRKTPVGVSGQGFGPQLQCCGGLLWSWFGGSVAAGRQTAEPGRRRNLSSSGEARGSESDVWTHSFIHPLQRFFIPFVHTAPFLRSNLHPEP